MKTEFQSMAPGIVSVKIFGRIDETAIFPKLENIPLSILILDLQNVECVNSMGILYWIRWCKDLLSRNPQMSFQVEYARMNIITTASVVAGFLPEKTQILSFYLNYYSEVESDLIQELQKQGLNYNDKKIEIQSKITKTVQGKQVVYELDCLPNRDLRCLKLEIDVI
ncbi:MAG: hypothetical protein ACXVCN_16435 [Bdellovibrio sp.]